MAGSSRRSRRKTGKNVLAARLIMLAVFAVLVFAAAGMPILKRWLPSTERKDLNEWFEVSGLQVKIYLDNEPENEVKGTVYDGEVYLPYEYIYANINERFYWNSNEGLLSYTLPGEVLDFDAQYSFGEHPVIIHSDSDAYISLSLVEKYTNISSKSYVSEEDTAKRVFINRGGKSVGAGTARKNTALRTAADKKAPILTDLKKGDVLYVTEMTAEWSRVATESGFIGYVKNDHISYDAAADQYVYPDTYTEPEIPYVMLDEKAVMAWQAVYSQAANNNFDSLYANTGGAINVISPQWLQISDANGNLIDFSSAEYVAKAHAAGLKVWPSVDNINQPGGVNDFSTRDFFADTEKRRSFISTLMQKAEAYGYDGINLDFEGLPADAGRSYTQFFRELSVECHKRGLSLSIDNYVPYSYNDHYNLEEQGVFADYVVIMGYDEHTGSDVGPVASISYTEYGIEEAKKRVPAEHIIAAVPLYTRVWRTNDGVTSSEAMGISASEQYVSNNAIVLNWDEETGLYYGETMIGSGQIQIWLEENRSLELKVQKIKEAGIGGIAAWRLGFEPADIWPVLDINSVG